MWNVTVIATGKMKERFYIAAVEEYARRLKSFCELRIVELPEVRLPEQPSEAQIAAALQKEAAAVREKLPKGAWLCVLTPEGKRLSSEDFARTLANVKTGGKSTACFVLGSSFGLDQELKKTADLRLSFSDMTFPHHLARVMLLEQLYRAETIQAGTKYHK